MKNLIAVLLVAVSATSCLTPQVRDKTLLPAIQSAWPGVRADVEYAGSMLESELIAWDSAVETGNFLALDTQDLEMQAIAGVNLRLEAGEIGPQGAAIMRDRASNFAAAVNEYMRSNVAMVTRPSGRVATVPDRPLVITRSSWATNPPSAIALRARGY